jgi:8-oxo-dGTP pyrophosphatase MutT (NUDIX family)
MTPLDSMDLIAPRRLSCGILILNGQQELLLCHVTGQDHWDLPKGGAHEGESPLQAALRETREETGLDLAAEVLRELGRFDYRPPSPSSTSKPPAAPPARARAPPRSPRCWSRAAASSGTTRA